MKVKKLDFVVLGGQKCESTFIQRVLENHPSITMFPGEVSFLEDSDFSEGGKALLDEYLTRDFGNNIVGIKRPNYLTRAEVLPRLKNLNREIKLVVIVRNPIDRVRSAYFHYINMGFIIPLPLNIGIQKFLKGKLAKNHPRSVEIIDFSLYHDHLKSYIDNFSSNVKVFLMEDLKVNRDEVIRDCYKFFQVDESYRPKADILDSRPQKVNYSIRRLRLIRLINPLRYEYWHGGMRINRKNSTGISLLIVYAVRLTDYIWATLIPVSKPDFSDDLRNQLNAIFRSDMEHLEVLLNKNLDSWK